MLESSVTEGHWYSMSSSKFYVRCIFQFFMSFIIHSLQCNHKVPESQLTVHIIAHHRKVRNHIDVYRHLTSWVPLHMDWISVVGKDFITEQKLRPEDFANNIINPDIPMDELGLLITAHSTTCILE